MYSTSLPNYKNVRNVTIVVTILLGLILFLVLNPFVTVSAGERGVVLTWGRVTDVLTEGIHWRTPIAQRVVKMDVRIQKEQVNAAASTKDLQDVSSTVALNFHVDPSKIGVLYQTVGTSYNDTIIAPAMQESVKAATANFTAEELITKREEVKDAIKNSLRDRLVTNGLTVDEFNIVNFQFSGAFNNAIEAKVTAEQNALAAKNKLEQVKFEADQRVAQAEAEAKAIQIQAQAITQQGGESYVQLKAVEKWNGVMPTYITGGSPLPFVNVTK